MRNLMLVAAVSLAVLAASSGTSPLPAQPEIKKDSPKPAETGLVGYWTEIYTETGGDNFSSINNDLLMIEGPRWNAGLYSPMLWKFGKSTIEIGPDRKGVFPVTRSSYRVDIDGKKGTMESSALDEKDPGKVGHSIYTLKDDLLIICGSSGPRPPERFTSSKYPKVGLTILRRGKLQPRGEWGGRVLRLPD